MSPLPAIAPISDLRVRQAEILEKAGQGPVILLERGSRPALVVVTPELWNAIAEHIEDLEDMVAAFRARFELATGRDDLVDVSPETIQEWLRDDVPPADLPQDAA
jgi:PHD/YefM family antitoxin component YafN of YafNO toxin-antitoxin module